MHSLSLTDSVRSILRLFVHGRVPISVVEDHTVRTSEVNTDATAASTRNEAEYLWVEIESIDHLLTSLDSHRAIQSNVGVAVQVEEGLQHVQHPRHLREDQHFGAFNVESFE